MADKKFEIISWEDLKEMPFIGIIWSVFSSKMGKPFLYVLIIGGALGGLWFVGNKLYTNYEITVENNRKLMEKSEADDQVIANQQVDASKAQTAFQSQITTNQQTQNAVDKTTKRNDPSTLSKIAISHPDMTAHAITSDAKDRNRCTELATGAIPTFHEINKQCQWIIDAYFKDHPVKAK